MSGKNPEINKPPAACEGLLKQSVHKDCGWLLLIFLPSILLITGIYFYTSMSVSKAIRVKGSQRMTQGLTDAVLEYSNKYQVFPEPAAPGSAESGLHRNADTDLDTSAGNWFVTVLARVDVPSPSAQSFEAEPAKPPGTEKDPTENAPRSRNPDGIDFLQWARPAKPAPRSPTACQWINGRYIDAATGRHGIVDSWGTEFRIRLDTDNNNKLANPNPREAAEGRPVLPGRVIVWCAGKDGDWNTWDDNIQSWN
ncbi:MAG: hypothetical protein JWL81_2220 [Verrucomicrobiales bacterium]|nr:hypothetical protein [Verrucomicrobiales bacterium]